MYVFAILYKISEKFVSFGLKATFVRYERVPLRFKGISFAGNLEIEVVRKVPVAICKEGF